ncbi:MAG: helix-turn-helix domain-containing protein [Thermoleophilia bacterium]|nr:helix-turn-helix domain-containing protein [Thermoleophilia bacterium]
MKDELFQELLPSVKQGAAIMRGTLQPSRTFEFPETEVRALRRQFGLTQDKFAHLMGISVGTLRNWEQGRRRPEGAARVLLRVASTHPEALLDAAGESKQDCQIGPEKLSNGF